MKTQPTVDIFTTKGDAIVVTTNGVVRTNGMLVMGAGIAKQFAERYPLLPDLLGKAVFDKGNHCYAFRADKILISFPTKYGYREPSSIVLIERSAHEIVAIAGRLDLKEIYMTPPGCGMGMLKWGDVRRVIENILDDRFIVLLPEKWMHL